MGLISRKILRNPSSLLFLWPPRYTKDGSEYVITWLVIS